MYVCLHVCMYVGWHACMYVRMCTYLDVCKSVSTHLCVHVDTNVYVKTNARTQPDPRAHTAHMTHTGSGPILLAFLWHAALSTAKLCSKGWFHTTEGRGV